MGKRNTASIKTIEVSSRQEWRKWLNENYDSQPEIWLVFRKRHTGAASLEYTDAVEEALCFGWIDSLVKRLDDELYARKFTPRKADSKWSTINRRRYADLSARGLLAAPGLQRPPTTRSGDAPRPSSIAIPRYIEERLKANQRAWGYFERLAPSYRRAYIAWVDSAKREETKEKRLQEMLSLLASGKKLGLK
jgi:uncharacterized protein YdeI (YjbR/CyaY-like superfamily)